MAFLLISKLRPNLGLAAILLALFFSAEAVAENWTRFRGPNGSGIAGAANIPATWTEKDYNWKIELPGKGHSSPALW